MARKRKSGGEPWQTSKPNSAYNRIFWDFEESDAWNVLSKKQQSLYFFAVKRRYLTIMHNRRGNIDRNISPAGRWQEYKAITDDCFYLNHALVVSAGLYSERGRRFYDDIAMLVKTGLIDIVVRGDGKTREKAVYKMSERWKDWKAPPNGKG